VKQHHESTASMAVYRRILGGYPGRSDRSSLTGLKQGLAAAGGEEIESLYYIIK
jgi:hypothetical protein